MTTHIASQADTLRAMTQGFRAKSALSQRPLVQAFGATVPRVIAVASGKGGVGKTSLVANLAVAFARENLRVLALDGDLGLANLDMLLGIQSQSSLLELTEGRAEIGQVIATGPLGIKVLPGCSGRYDLANLSNADRNSLFTAVEHLGEDFDALLIDTAAGIGSNAIYFAGAAQQVVVVATPEPTSLADAYAFIKVLWERCRVHQVHLVANMVSNAAQGEEVYRKLCTLADRFLGVGIDYLGAIVRDQAMTRSVHARTPALIHEQKAIASKCIEAIARKLIASPIAKEVSGGISLFWKRLLVEEAAT